MNVPGGWLSYDYWPAPEWAVRITAGALNVETLSSVQPGAVESRSAAITAVLFGVRYHPEPFALGSVGRPFADLSIGPHVGTATNSVVGQTVQTQDVSETVFGGRAQIGLDLFAGRHFLAELGFGYHWTADFGEPIGRGKDYSGPEFMVGLGVMLGAGRSP